jgi:3-hydroxyisobutyrate dehydrogenase-like beta-hydroxyacid dehydrogenase
MKLGFIGTGRMGGAMVTRLLAAKYGLQFKAFLLVERVLARGERRREVIRIVPARVVAEADPR